jgi:hypothetical protein
MDEIYALSFNEIKVPSDTAVHSEHGKVTRCDIKLRLAQRSIDQWNHFIE